MPPPTGVLYICVDFVCRGSHPCLCYVNPTDLGTTKTPAGGETLQAGGVNPCTAA